MSCTFAAPPGTRATMRVDLRLRQLHQRQHLRRDRRRSRPGSGSAAPPPRHARRPPLRPAPPASASANSARTSACSPRRRIRSISVHRQQRVPAQLEEVVVHAPPAPRRSTSAQIAASASSTGVRGASYAASAYAPRLRRRQRLAVQLAVRRQRQRLQHARTPPAPCTPAALRRRCSRSVVRLRARPPRTPPAACRPARPRAPPPRASRTAGCAASTRLDLAQLDAEAADLHLVVHAAQELQRRRPPATAPGRRCGTAARPAPPRTGRGRSAPPSAPAGPGSRAPPRAPPMYSSPGTPTGTGSPRRVQHVERARSPIGRPIGPCPRPVHVRRTACVRAPRRSSRWARTGRAARAAGQRRRAAPPAALGRRPVAAHEERAAAGASRRRARAPRWTSCRSQRGDGVHARVRVRDLAPAARGDVQHAASRSTRRTAPRAASAPQSLEDARRRRRTRSTPAPRRRRRRRTRSSRGGQQVAPRRGACTITPLGVPVRPGGVDDVRQVLRASRRAPGSRPTPPRSASASSSTRTTAHAVAGGQRRAQRRLRQQHAARPRRPA